MDYPQWPFIFWPERPGHPPDAQVIRLDSLASTLAAAHQVGRMFRTLIEQQGVAVSYFLCQKVWVSFARGFFGLSLDGSDATEGFQ